MSPSDDNDENPWDVKDDDIGMAKKTKKDEDSGPFQRGGVGSQPPEFSKVIEDFKKRFKQNSKGFAGKGSGGGLTPQSQGQILLIILGVIFLIWLGSGFYVVEEGAAAVVLRFGKYVRSALPGLRYRMPAPIEQEIIRNVSTSNIIQSNTQEGDAEHSLILTGDENMVITNYTVTWKIKDIVEYLFMVRRPEETIRAAAESALRDAMGQTTARQALTEGRGEIGAMAQDILQKILDSYNAGIQIIQFQLQRVEPPAQVVEAFNDMQASRVDADRLSNEAQSYSNDILPRARGQSESILRGAEAYAAEIVAKAEGEASRFTQVLKSNNKNPAITRIRMHREVMDEILKQGNVTIVDHDLSKSLQNYNQLTPVPLLNKKEGA